MGLFSQATLEQIRAASDIVDVIGSYLPLKRAGANFVALCPFHKEKSPSFNVNPHRQIFHCFGCHKGGDVFTFVKEYESIDFVEAVRRLADRAKIPLVYDQNPGEQQSRHIKEQLLQIHEQIAQRWQMALANDAAGQIARDYLGKRGVAAEAIKVFRLGYAPDLWDDTVNWARGRGYELELVEKAGLIIRREGADGYYDRFRGRLMFPICDEQGRVVGFSGRVLTGDEKTAKYVNSPETPIFTKGRILFALDKAKRTILDAGYVVVCEGQLDTISCHSAGVTNVVAPQGTALTGQHVRALQRFTNDIILCFDGDSAGRKAAARGFDELIQLGVPFRVAEIPAPEDPDSFLKKFGAAAFFDLILHSRDFFEWYLDYLVQNHGVSSDRGRIAVIQGMAEVLKHPDNAVLTDTYLQRTALKLGISYEAARSQFAKLSRRSSPAERLTSEAAPQPAAAPTPIPPRELWLLRVLLTSDDLVAWVAERLDFAWLQHATARRLIEARIGAFHNHSWSGVAGFLDAIQDDDARNLITELVTDKRQIPNPEKTLKGDPSLADKRGILEQLRDEFIERQMAALRLRSNQPGISELEQVELLRQQQKLRAVKRQPLARTHAVDPNASAS